MRFEDIRKIVLSFQDEHPSCLRYTKAYDTHNWELYEVSTIRDGESSGYNIYTYKCPDCGYYLDMLAHHSPGVCDFTGHMGNCDDEIKTCEDARQQPSLERIRECQTKDSQK